MLSHYGQISARCFFLLIVSMYSALQCPWEVFVVAPWSTLVSIFTTFTCCRTFETCALLRHDLDKAFFYTQLHSSPLTTTKTGYNLYACDTNLLFTATAEMLLSPFCDMFVACQSNFFISPNFAHWAFSLSLLCWNSSLLEYGSFAKRQNVADVLKDKKNYVITGLAGLVDKHQP